MSSASQFSVSKRWKLMLATPASLWTALIFTGAIAGLIAPIAQASETAATILPAVAASRLSTSATLQPAATLADPSTADASTAKVSAKQPILLAGATTTSKAIDALSSVAEFQPASYDANAPEDDPTAIDQVTSVSQLTDVKPTDWAFQALQSLVERYGCIVGYPDKTFKGNRALTRYEFAAGLNACMDRINELIAAGTANLVKKEDLLAVQKLQEEFAAEIATLRGRVGALEARSATIEAQQFSTTTKLNGLVWFNLTAAGAGRDVTYEGPDSAVVDMTPVMGVSLTPVTSSGPRGGQPTRQVTGSPNTTFGFNTWLTFNTSFSGKDSLVTQLAAGNSISPANQYASAGFFNSYGVPFTDQTSGTVNGRSDVVIHDLFYSFPLNDSIKITVGPRVNWYRHFDFNRFTFFLTGASSFDSIGSTQTNTIDRGSGAVIEWKINKQFRLAVAYLGENTEFLTSALFNSSSNPAQGLFNGTNTTTAELTFSPTENINLRFMYNRTNFQQIFGTIGGALGEPIPYGYLDGGFNGPPLQNSNADTFTFNFDWLITKGFGVFGRYGYGSTHLAPISQDVNVQSFQVGIGLPDFLKKGALGVVTFLMPMDILRGRRYFVSGAGDGGIMYELEASYFYPLSEHIAIVPAFYAIFNPNNFDSNPTIFVGNLRAQFSF